MLAKKERIIMDFNYIFFLYNVILLVSAIISAKLSFIKCPVITSLKHHTAENDVQTKCYTILFTYCKHILVIHFLPKLILTFRFCFSILFPLFLFT